MEEYRRELHARIDENPKFSPEYRARLKDLYEYFADRGYVFSAHALGRVMGQKKSKGKREFTVAEVLEILAMPPNYTQEGIKWVRYYHGIAIIQGMDNGDIISVNSHNKPGGKWEAID